MNPAPKGDIADPFLLVLEKFHGCGAQFLWVGLPGREKEESNIEYLLVGGILCVSAKKELITLGKRGKVKQSR